MHRAHRYSFTLASSGWVSVDLEPTGSGDDALDTYLLLLAGHGSGGEVLDSHNNLRGDATELDDLYLTAGDYTVEATTALSNATGGYRIAIEGDFAAQSDELPATVTAAVSLTAKQPFRLSAAGRHGQRAERESGRPECVGHRRARVRRGRTYARQGPHQHGHGGVHSFRAHEHPPDRRHWLLPDRLPGQPRRHLSFAHAYA